MSAEDTEHCGRQWADVGLGVLHRHGEFSLLATRRASAGEHLFRVDGDLTSTPSRYSVQVGEGVHIDLHDEHRLGELLDAYYWRFMNHSCEPNAVIRGRDVFALWGIEPWEQVTFDYNTTELELADPFDCSCGSSRCVGRVSGFRFLDRMAREQLRPLLAPHLLTHLDVPVPEARR